MNHSAVQSTVQTRMRNLASHLQKKILTSFPRNLKNTRGPCRTSFSQDANIEKNKSPTEMNPYPGCFLIIPANPHHHTRRCKLFYVQLNRIPILGGYRQTDRQTDRQRLTDRQTHRDSRTDRQTQTDGQNTPITVRFGRYGP